MTAFAPDELITLDQAAGLIPGATADSLKRLARRGILTCYRPGKSHLTTPADVREAVNKCRVEQKARVCGSAPRAETPPATLPMPAPGSSSTELAKSALDSARAQLRGKKRKH